MGVETNGATSGGRQPGQSGTKIDRGRRHGDVARDSACVHAAGANAGLGGRLAGLFLLCWRARAVCKACVHLKRCTGVH